MDKGEVLKAIRREGPGRIPVWYDYFAAETEQKYADALREIKQEYRDDMAMCLVHDHDWGVTERHAEGGVGSQVHDALLEDWDQLDAYLDPERDAQGRFARHFPCARDGDILAAAVAKKAQAGPDQFVMGYWWRGFFERLHYLRNMENTFADLLVEREHVERLLDRIELYLQGIVDRVCGELGADGIFFGDDYGMQDRLMMSPALFREVFKPRLARLIGYCHRQGRVVGMHTCGNVTDILPDLIDIGLDFLHPIQPGAMDAGRVVREYGRDLCFFGGVDVQYLLPRGTPEQIDREIRDAFALFRSGGGFMAGFANSVMPETPLENIRAALAAMKKYASE